MGKKKTKDIFEYSPAPESTGHIQINEKYDLFIGNKWVKPEKGKYFNTINPASEDVLAQIAQANEKDVDKAVKSARKAFRSWFSRNSSKF